VGRLAALATWLRGRLGGRAAGRRPDEVVVHDVTTPPDEVEAYWTDERIREATPREQRLDPPAV
jgi:hypothetical protein